MSEEEAPRSEATASEAPSEETNSEPQEVAAEAKKAPPGGASDPWPLDRVIDVPLHLSVEVGRAKMLVRDVLQLSRGSVIPLDRASGAPADILVNGRLIARGELTVVDDELAVRVVEVMTGESREDGR